VGNRVFSDGMSVGYARVALIQSHKYKEMWFLTYQTNMYREVSSGFCWMLVTNSTIARLMRSDSFILNFSQMSVMSSLRVSGIRKQVW
jgi:hypothetical protein